jgi:Protein of unknown function (DUF3489)
MVRALYQRQCSWTAYLAKHLGRVAILHARTVVALPHRSAARDDLLGWQAHSMRGALSGALKKKLRLTIESLKVEARGRVYRLAD